MSFHKFSQTISDLVGSFQAFICAVIIVVIWTVGGPIFHYSDTWQLIMNTVSSIITFVMVFLIQHAQNRETRAINLKLDEIIRSLENSRKEIIDIENVPGDKISEHKAQIIQEIKGHLGS